MQTKKTDTSKSEKAAAVAGKTWTILKSETTAFVIGLLCVIFGVYLLLAFSSFFFTGGNDQSILSHPNPSELLETGNRIQNYAGARGAQLAQFLINDCFGFSAYCIIIFLVVAGMKLKELMDAGTVTDPKVGYVGAYPYAEVVCGYTAFLLGIQTQVPEAYMEVQYTNSWYDPVAEGEAANALMARGCVIIGQHADSTGAPSAVQAQKDAGSVVYSVGYNIDMLEVAPTAALTSSQNNWSVLYRDTLEKFIAGEEVPVDYAVGISEDAVMISKLGPECAEGTQEAVDAAWSSIKDGSLKVFDTSKFTCQPAADGSYQVDADGHVTSAFGLDSDGDFVNDTGEAIVDGAFQESVLRSAPYFSLRIDGITELNNN